jgi:hypothetical protein
MKVSKYAAETMARLEAEGHKLTVPDVLQLNALGLRVECPCGESSGYDVPLVAFAGDVAFHELTIAAGEWLEQCAVQWWSGKDLYRARAYAHVKGREAGAFDGALLNRRSAQMVIRAFWNSLPVSEMEIVTAVQALESDDTSSTDNDDASGRVRSLVADVVAATGVNPGALRTEAISFATDVIRAWTRQQAARGGSGDTSASAIGKANADFYRAVAAIEKRKATA